MKRKDVNVIGVTFPGSPRVYDFLIPKGVTITTADQVVVRTQFGTSIADVQLIRDDDYCLAPSIKYKFIVQVINDEQHQEWTKSYEE